MQEAWCTYVIIIIWRLQKQQSLDLVQGRVAYPIGQLVAFK